MTDNYIEPDFIETTLPKLRPIPCLKLHVIRRLSVHPHLLNTPLTPILGVSQFPFPSSKWVFRSGFSTKILLFS